MSLIPHTINNYNDVLRELCTENEGFRGKVYYNKDDTPTIGYGLALYNKKSGAKESTAFDDIKKAGINISKTDEKIFHKIETAMQANPRNDITIKKLVNQLDLDLGSEKTGKKVYSYTAERYEAATKSALGTTLYDELKDSKELASLVDLVYNGGGGIIGPGMKHALEHGNRAEAWFQMRYDSNGGASRGSAGKGLADRRVRESNMFSLYDENPNVENMKDIIRMSRFHADKIGDEEHAFPTVYSGEQSITEQIQPAKDYLIEAFGKNVIVDGKVIVGNDTVNDNSTNGGHTHTNDTLDGTEKNDLIFGEKGDDILRGNAGNDILYGGEGADKLYGGIGNDTYMAGEGDTIKDTDNQGKIYFDATLLSGTKYKVSKDVYEDTMFTYSQKGNNLIITQKEDSSKSITVENWNTHKETLGIKLSNEQTHTHHTSILPHGTAVSNAQVAKFDTNKNKNDLIQEKEDTAVLTEDGIILPASSIAYKDIKDIELASDTTKNNDDDNCMVM